MLFSQYPIGWGNKVTSYLIVATECSIKKSLAPRKINPDDEEIHPVKSKIYCDIYLAPMLQFRVYPVSS